MSLIDELASPEITVYYPATPGVIKGIAALKGYFTRFPSFFGDTDMQVEKVIAEGDKVVLRYNWSAIHQGEWPPGAPPATGKRVKMTGIVIYHIVDGKVVDERGEEDYIGLFRELGIYPKPRTQ